MAIVWGQSWGQANGELIIDRRKVEIEEATRDAALVLVASCPYLAGGDTIRVVDISEPHVMISSISM